MRRRRLRWIGVGVVLLVGLYFVLDVVVHQYLESKGAAEIARTMSAESATINLGSFPFLPGFLIGHLSNVTVDVQGSTSSGGLRVDSISADMKEVKFSPSDMFALARSSFATKSKITAIQPHAIVTLKEQDLEDFIRRSIPVVGDVQVKASGIEIRFLKPSVEISPNDQPTKLDLTDPARYLPAMRDGHLVLSLIGFAQVSIVNRFDAQRLENLINLPRFPTGLSNDVRLSDGLLVIESQGPSMSIWVGEGSKR